MSVCIHKFDIDNSNSYLDNFVDISTYYNMLKKENKEIKDFLKKSDINNFKTHTIIQKTNNLPLDTDNIVKNTNESKNILKPKMKYTV